MEENKVSASLNIDAKYIETEVQRIVKAAIVEALGNKDEIIRKAIDSTIDQYVTPDGKPCEKGRWNAIPYLDYMAQQTVEKTVREAFLEIVEENSEDFKEEVKRQLGKRKWKQNTADAFVQLLMDSAKSEWKMPVHVTFEKPEE